MDKTEIYLNYIKNACEIIQQLIEGMELGSFTSDGQCQAAVIQGIEMIGDAAGNIDLTFQEKHGEIPWNQMIGMRNRLIHDYNEIDIDLVWQTIQKDIPELLRKINCILEEET